MEKKHLNLNDIIEQFELKIVCGTDFLNREISGGYVSDLLSDVIANINEGDIWITLQGHSNIIAVAVLKELAGIILINGHQADENTIKKAISEEIPILTSNLPAFELVGKLYQFGIHGMS